MKGLKQKRELSVLKECDKNMKKVIVNINLEISAPNAKTDEEAKKVAENYELPSGYVEDSFEIVKVINEDDNKDEKECQQEQIRQIVKNTIVNNSEIVGDWSDGELRIDVNDFDHIAEEVAEKIAKLVEQKP